MDKVLTLRVPALSYALFRSKGKGAARRNGRGDKEGAGVNPSTDSA